MMLSLSLSVFLWFSFVLRFATTAIISDLQDYQQIETKPTLELLCEHTQHVRDTKPQQMNEWKKNI